MFGVPELIVATPSRNAFTVKLAVPPEGIVRDSGDETMDRSVLFKTIVRFLPMGGMTEAVIVPVPDGAIVSPGGSKLNLDEERVIEILDEPYSVVTVMFAVPGLAVGETVKSPFTAVSLTEIFLRLTNGLSDVIVFAVNRFCPVIITGVVKPINARSGMML